MCSQGHHSLGEGTGEGEGHTAELHFIKTTQAATWKMNWRGTMVDASRRCDRPKIKTDYRLSICKETSTLNIA